MNNHHTRLTYTANRDCFIPDIDYLKRLPIFSESMDE